MTELQGTPAASGVAEGKWNGEKQRTFKDTLLISAWVATYAGVLTAFRVAKALEGLFSSEQGKAPEGRTGRGSAKPG